MSQPYTSKREFLEELERIIREYEWQEGETASNQQQAQVQPTTVQTTTPSYWYQPQKQELPPSNVRLPATIWGTNHEISSVRGDIFEEQLRIELLKKYRDDILHGKVPEYMDVPPRIRREFSGIVDNIKKAGAVGTSLGGMILDSLIQNLEGKVRQHSADVNKLDGHQKEQVLKKSLKILKPR